MIAGAGPARPRDAVEIILRTDHNHRDISAAGLLPQPDDEFRGLAFARRGCQENQIGAVLRTKQQRHTGIDKALREGWAAQRAHQSFLDLQIRVAVIDDDHQL